MSGSEDPTRIDGDSGVSSSSGATGGWDAALDDRFEPRGLLGRGATGAVFRALQRSSGREVALKLATGELDAHRLARFAREGELTARLEHPGIVTVHAAGQVRGRPWIAYELIEGVGTLEGVWRSSPLRRKVELLRDTARALGHAHARGVVHRDVKPENVLVDPQGRVRVADFGLAGAFDAERLTQTGAMLGTPSFMAPELYEGRRDDVGPPTDVWALGVMLYEALCGQLPFQGRSLLALGAEITAARPTPPSRVGTEEVPADLEALGLRCLRADPAERLPDGEAFARALDGWLRGEGTGLGPAASDRRPLIALGGAAALCLALAGGALLWASRGATPPPAPAPTPGAPRLTVLEPSAQPARALTRRLRLVVEVEGPDGARLGIGSRSHRPRDGRVEVEVELTPGAQTLALQLRVPGPDGAPRVVAEQALAVECFDAPAWFVELPPAARAPLPLPAGLTFGERSGDYLSAQGVVLVWVPPGTFTMGSDQPQPMGEPEAPAHEVTLTRGVFLGKHEVSWGEYRRYRREAGLDPPAFGEGEPSDHPAWGLTWLDARDYCAWAGGRLPTEAEWERAARGDDGRLFPWGPEHDARRANLRDSGLVDRYERTSGRGSFPLGASPYGVQDMIGNVWEWTGDYYGRYSAQPQVDPQGPWTSDEREGQGKQRVMRGGSWNSDPLQTTTRGIGGEEYASSNTGLRLAVEAP